MTDYQGIALIITALATLVTSFGALVIGVLNARKIEQVHVATNSKMDKLLSVTRESAEAKGLLQGRNEVGKQKG